MGYDTRYTLTTKPALTKRQIKAMIALTDEFLWLFGGDEDRIEPGDEFEDTWKWYSHEEDMLAASAKLPAVLFTLAGEGESQGDVWEKRFQAGKKLGSKRARVVMEDEP